MGDVLLPRGLDILLDGRQSPAALAIARGTTRCLDAYNFAAITELTLANGRRADMVGMSDGGEIWIIEIKSSVEDFKSDQKWQEYRDYCDRFYFAVGPDFPRDLIPPGIGLIVADRYQGEVVRPANPHRLAANRRRAVITRFARVAALRLQTVIDPVYERPIRG